MQVAVETQGALGRKLTLRLPSEHIDRQLGGRLREIAKTARINGFRPGKVPIKVIERRFGQQVRGEIVSDLVGERFNEVVRENEFRIAGRPQIEPAEAAAEGEHAFVATFEVVPDFGDLDVSKLSVVRHVADVTEADIDRMLDNLRQQRQGWTVVEREAQNGDALELGIWLLVDGKRLPEEGVNRSTTILGSGMLLAEIETNLIGIGKDQEKVFEVTFPGDWRMSDVAGKKVEVHAVATKISEPLLPEVDAAFIKSFGIKSGDLTEFRSEIRNNLERELKGALMNRLRTEVGQQIIEHWKQVELPPRLVETEARALLARQLEQQREQAQRSGQSEDIPPPAQDAWKEFVDTAKNRVLVGLLVGEVARKNELTLDVARLTEHLRLIASTYEEPEQVIEMYRNDTQLMAGLQNLVMEEQVIDWIAERAQHTEKTVSFQEALALQ